jgi:hypothetical protein
MMVSDLRRNSSFPIKTRTSLNGVHPKLRDTIKIQSPIKDPLAVLQRGGKARLVDGRVIEYNVSGQGDPILLGQRYLFFLSYHKEADAYHVIKMWHVENGVIKAAYPAEKAAASRFQSENDGRLLPDVIYSLRARQRNYKYPIQK